MLRHRALWRDGVPLRDHSLQGKGLRHQRWTRLDVRSPWFRRYGVALSTVALVLLLILLVSPLTAQTGFSLLLAAVVLSAWYGGLWPGLLAMALSVLGSACFLLPPRYSLAIATSGDLVSLGAFVLVSLLVTWLNVSRQGAEEALQRANAALEQRVQDRTAVLAHANAALQAEMAERMRAEQLLHESAARWHVMIDTIPAMVWMAGPDTLCTFFNKPWLAFTGRTLEQERGQGWADGVHPDDVQRCVATYVAAFHARQPFRMEYRIRRVDGAYRWVLDTGVPQVAPDGRFEGYIGVGIDITERHDMEAQLQALLHAHEVLLREIHHRVKNNFQIISSLLRLQAMLIPEPQIRELFLESQRRIHAMALIHEHLYRAHDFARVNFAQHLRELVIHLVDAYGVDTQRITIQITAEDLPLDLDTAMPCGLILQELVSNCLKHAFPAGRCGEIHIELQAAQPGMFTLRVRDNGIGLPDEWNGRHPPSLGLRLIRLLTEQLAGRLDLDCSQGTAWTLTCQTSPTVLGLDPCAK
jgi:PAS domain S-box-containing protein